MMIRYSPAASRDISLIKDYIGFELKSPKAAASTVIKIIKSCARLKKQPGLGLSLSAKTGRDTDIRYIITGHYIILYRIQDECIDILRVLDDRTDYMNEIFK